MSATVAALFVARSGHYWGRDDVDAWDERRDARLYDGDLPVVAHPPCTRWVNLACVNYCRYRKPELRPGRDGGCFARALSAVRNHGGVLEHPAMSHAWETFWLRVPTGAGWERDAHGGWVCEVCQSAYGHQARKRTWLYYSGRNPPESLDWSRPAGTHQVGWFDRAKPTLSKSAANATPMAFAEALLSLARLSGGAPAQAEAAQ